MKITKHVFRNAGNTDGSSTIPPSELELAEGNAAGIGISISAPAHSGPPIRANFPLTPTEARKVGERLVAYAVANGAT